MVSQQLENYMERIIKLAPADIEGNYSGTFDSLYYTRKGINKYIYSIDYKIHPLIKPGKVTLDYWITGISRYSIVCDQTQKQSFSSLEVNRMSNELKEAFLDIANNFADCIRDYLKKGVEESPKLIKRPYWYPLSYIVADNNVSYFTILHSQKGLSKEQLYKVLENYFTYAYGSGKAVIENKNPQDCSIIAKGLYADIHRYSGWAFENYDVKHIISIQCRDGRVRITITIGDYDIHKKGKQMFGPTDYTRNIAAYEPFGSEQDKEMEECLKKLELRIISQFKDMQKAIDEGNTAVDTLDNW